AATADPGSLRITRAGPTNSALTVSYTVGGSAVSGTDYVPINSSTVIPAGAAQVDLMVKPIQNAQLENNRTVAVTLSIDGTYRVPSTAASATVTILNLVPPTITAQPQS